MMTQCWWHSGGHSRTGGSKLLRWRRCCPRRGWWCLDPTDPAAPRRPFAHIPAICCRLLHICPQHCMHQSQHTSHTLRVAGVGYDFISSSSASIALTLTCLLDFFGIGCKHEVFRSGSSRGAEEGPLRLDRQTNPVLVLYRVSSSESTRTGLNSCGQLEPRNLAAESAVAARGLRG